jgi:hypothetical protein
MRERGKRRFIVVFHHPAGTSTLPCWGLALCGALLGNLLLDRGELFTAGLHASVHQDFPPMKIPPAEVAHVGIDDDIGLLGKIFRCLRMDNIDRPRQHLNKTRRALYLNSLRVPSDTHRNNRIGTFAQ